MPRISIAKEDGIVMLELELDPRKCYTLGRSASASIRLDAPSVSRHHAILLPYGDRWVVADLGSSRGVWNEDGRIHSGELSPGKWISLGAGYIWFEDERTAHEANGAASLEMEPGDTQEIHAPDAVLLLEEAGGGLPRVIRMNRRRGFTIGSSETCDVQVQHAEIEPLHAAVFPFKGGWRTVSMCESDLLGGDGLPCRSTPLDAETTVFAGPLGLTIRMVETSPAAPPSALCPVENGFEEPDFEGEVDLEALARSGAQEDNDGSTVAGT